MASGAAAEALADFKRKMADAEAEADRDAAELAARDADMIAEVGDFVGSIVKELNDRDRLCHRVSYSGNYDLKQKKSTVKYRCVGLPNHPMDNVDTPEIIVVFEQTTIYVGGKSCGGRQLAPTFAAIVDIFSAKFGPRSERDQLAGVPSAREQLVGIAPPTV